MHTDLDQDGLSDLCMVNQNAGPEDGSLSALLNDLAPEGGEDCPGDFNGDGDVNILDFLILLEAWGVCDTPCDADLDGDGQVGILDLLELLHLFGPCVVDNPLNCPWDLHGDRIVSFADVLIVLGHFGPCPP